MAASVRLQFSDAMNDHECPARLI